jgi:hypothetical protein
MFKLRNPLCYISKHALLTIFISKLVWLGSEAKIPFCSNFTKRWVNKDGSSHRRRRRHKTHVSAFVFTYLITDGLRCCCPELTILCYRTELPIGQKQTLRNLVFYLICAQV